MDTIFNTNPYTGKPYVQNTITPTTPLDKVVMHNESPSPSILKVASDTLKAALNVANKIAQPVANYIAPNITSIGQDIQQGGIKKVADTIFKPDDQIKKAENLIKSGNFKEGANIVKERANNYALAFAGSADFENVAKPLIQNISKEVNPTIIKGLLDKLGVNKDLIPGLANKLSKVTNEDEIVNIIKNGSQELSSLVKPRGFTESVVNSPKTIEQVAKGAESYYLPQSNQQLVSEATRVIKNNMDEAIRVAKSPEWSAKSNVYAQQLIQEFQNAGRYQDAIDMIENLSSKATSQGQAIQALSLYNKLTPQGILKYAQRIIDQANNGKIGKVTLDENFAKKIVDMATELQKMPEGRQKIVNTAKLLQTIADKVPTSLGQYVSTIQTFAQLLNPKTAIRNVIGNAGFQVLENIKDIPATFLDSAISLVTKERTKSLPNLSKQFSGFKEGLTQGVEDALNRIDTSNIPTKFDLPKSRTFKGDNIAGKVGASLEKFLNIELKAPDRAFYKSAYDGSLAEQMVAKKTTIPTDQMKEIAHLDALYRTFQDDNVVSKVFTGIKKALNAGKSFGVGDFVIKYPKTPANLLARGIEYSPGGFVNSIIEAVRPIAGKPFNQRAFVESFSRALTGTTTLVGTGALLHKLGIITGRPEKDADIKGIQKISGLGQYRINVDALKRFVFSGFNPETTKLQNDDHLVSYDWFQPAAIGIAMGANIDEGNGIKGDVASAIGSITQSVNTLAEQPLISGITNILRSGDLATSLEEVLKGVPSSFIPTIASQINQLIDNTQRNAYDPNIYQYAFNLAKQKIPGLAQTLPPSIDVFGDNIERYQGDSNNLFNVLFNPAFVSKYQKTPEAQMVLDLMNQTGETKQSPKVVNKSYTINGEKKYLNSRQITAMQRYVGTVTKELFNSFANDMNFQNLPPADKVKYLSGVLSDIGEAGKIVILGDRPQKPGKNALQIIQMFNGRK